MEGEVFHGKNPTKMLQLKMRARGARVDGDAECSSNVLKGTTATARIRGRNEHTQNRRTAHKRPLSEFRFRWLITQIIEF